jgi:hypothetical protein
MYVQNHGIYKILLIYFFPSQKSYTLSVSNLKTKQLFMKQRSLSLFVLCMLAACNTATKSDNTTDTTATTSSSENVTYAYTPMYSADFEIGDPKYAQTVLELWKDFDNNTFDNHKDAFADSVRMEFPDGSNMDGTRDSVINGAKMYRGSLASVASSIDAVVTLKPKGKDETWVSVWGKEVDTHKDGKVDSIYYNENWMFNKDGKIAYMSQFEQHPQKK